MVVRTSHIIIWGLRGGGTLIFSYIGSGHFLGSKFLNINIIFFRFQKNKYFWGMKILSIYFGSHRKIGLYLGVISMHFMIFS